jgi:hypothetical protein
MIPSSRLFRYLASAAMLTVSALAMSQSPSPSPDRGIEGAWNVTVTFNAQGLPPCAPAGTLITAVNANSGSIMAESCYASEGAGYGSWVRTGPNQFAATFIGNSFGAGGTVASTYKVRSSVSLGSANTFSGPFTTDFFDLQGHLLGTVTGTVSAVRIPVEP